MSNIKSNYINLEYTQDKIQIPAYRKQSLRYKLSAHKTRVNDLDLLMSWSDLQYLKAQRNQIFSRTEDYEQKYRGIRNNIVMVKSIPLHQKQNIEPLPKYFEKSVKPKGRKTLDNIIFGVNESEAILNQRHSTSKTHLKRSLPINSNIKLQEFSDKNYTPQIKPKSYHTKLHKKQVQNTILVNHKTQEKHQFEGIGGNKMVAFKKSDSLLDYKVLSYLHQVKQNQYLYNLEKIVQNSQKITKLRKKNCPKIRIKKGNNHQLIKQLFKKRWWWIIQQQKQTKTLPNFIWSQLKDKTYLNIPQNIPSNKVHNSHNHFPFNQYLGNKKALFHNMQNYYTSHNINTFEYLPLTFHVVSLGDQQWKQFQNIYKENQSGNLNNTWIVKPGQNSNRGKGIIVTENIRQIESMVISANQEQQQEDQNANNQIKHSYIIQKYIDKPFLYNNRKFDIRAYMLIANINNVMKGFWYSEGYIRTSSFQYQLNDLNGYIHLTNDAIQNHSQNYGKYEDGNKLSYVQFQKYLDSKYPECKYNINEQIVPKMKEIAMQSIQATYTLLKGNKLDIPVFEIFGLDFMVDSQFKPWLIQVNTNPCLETSCNVLQRVIPKMLDDAFKLTVDVLFMPPDNWPGAKKHLVPSLQNKFQLIFSNEGTAKTAIPLYLDGITEDQQVYSDQ